jgi:alkylhydroperoxidase/carboxymuconolactone decarboxylase family protein YurZ
MGKMSSENQVPNREGTLKRIAPGVFRALYGTDGLIANVNACSPFDTKTKELILVATFATNLAFRGMGEHVRRAAAAGATNEEIFSAILLTLPVIGIPHVNTALEQAEATLGLEQA